MLKRSFIPPEYRPYVTGSKVNYKLEETNTTKESQKLFEMICDEKLRRSLIVNLINENILLDELDPHWVKSVLLELFPKLHSIKE